MPRPLYEHTQDREREAIKRLFVDPAPGMVLQGLGIPEWCWLGICIPSDRLGRERGAQPGDVDVCGGRLVPVDEEAYEAARRDAAALQRPEEELPEVSQEAWFPPGHRERSRARVRDYLASLLLLERGQIKPALDPLFALEVKVSRVGVDGRLRGTRTGGSPQKEARDQAQGLAEMGFDHVGLLRVLVTEPCPNPRGSAWLHAGSHASDGARRYEEDIIAREEDPFRTAVASIGAIDGRVESEAGSLGVEVLGGQWCNPLLGEPATTAAREPLHTTLRAALDEAGPPRRVPMLVLACASASCRHLFVPRADAPVPWEAHCPRCGGVTTATME